MIDPSKFTTITSNPVLRTDEPVESGTLAGWKDVTLPLGGASVLVLLSTHDLGYIPVVRVWVERITEEFAGDLQLAGAGGGLSLTYNVADSAIGVNTSVLVIDIAANFMNEDAGHSINDLVPFRIHYRIYTDGYYD